jgi:pSer/pThr/pTyr-binding forkhead associated (FHA) protein
MAVEPLKALFKITGPSLPIDEIIIAEDKPIRFGRTTDNDFELPNREISRQHLRLFWRDGNVWAEDLNSANGVWVNDVRVRPGSPSKLQPGDVIRIGPFLLTYTSNLQQEIIVKPLMDMDSPTMPDMPAPRDVKPVESGAAEKAASSLLEVFEPTLSGADLNIAEIMRRAAQEAGKAVEEFAAEVGIAPMTNLFPADTGVGSDASLPPDDYLPVVTAEKEYPIGTPTDRSNWLQYLPSIYQNDEFIGRYLLVFESMMNPLSGCNGWAVGSTC